MTDRRPRRIGGWGFEGESLLPSPQLLAWLGTHVGPPGVPLPAAVLAPPDLPAAVLNDLPGALSTDPLDRLAHARGQGLTDILRMRGQLVTALPDAVCRPSTAHEAEAVLDACNRQRIRVVPWGGGTSVTGGVNVLPQDVPLVTMDMEGLSGLVHLDATSGLATFGAGTTGPMVEAALAPHGLTLGHYPQSWELSTVGGWIATRSAGQESTGYGAIESLVAGVELSAPAGRLALPALPASAAGPDLRQLVLGSEGRLGIITAATLRVRARPEAVRIEGALLPSFDEGAEAVRTLIRDGARLTLVRLSDPAETEVAMAAGLGASAAGFLLRPYLRLRGIGEQACLLLFGASGRSSEARATIRHAGDLLRARHAVMLGGRPGKQWLRDRFRHPYLREELLDRGYGVETLETAVPWSGVLRTRHNVVAQIASALGEWDERLAVLCHLSHAYPDGVSLYFTVFFRCADPAATIVRWARIKRAATAAILAAGGTLSHHHGIGQWHARWLSAEIGADGLALLATTARQMDPSGILNPHVLLEVEDRLEG